jgi:TonB family protein
MQKAQIYTSSGVAELDEAAVRWTQQARFLPAQRDQQAIDGTMVFKVRFMLRQ